MKKIMLLLLLFSVLLSFSGTSAMKGATGLLSFKTAKWLVVGPFDNDLSKDLTNNCLGFNIDYLASIGG